MAYELKHIQRTRKNGVRRYYFRKPGFPRCALPGEPGSIEFLAAYQRALEQGPSAQVGASRNKPGTIAWAVAEYLGSVDFAKRPPSVQQKHRRHLERFRVEHGDRTIAGLDIERVERLQMRFITVTGGGKAAGNQWLDAIRDLMAYAVRKKMIAVSPAADVKKFARQGEHRTWTVGEVEQFRAQYPVGTKARLALELMVTLALRRSDVTRVGPHQIRNGVLNYVQHKNARNKPIALSVPIPTDLMLIIEATRRAAKLVRPDRFLVTKLGTAYQDDSFSEWFRPICDAAGLPKDCTAHGLRKRCCADLANRGATAHEIMSISGHRTLKEVDRYTRAANQEALAVEAMRKQAAGNEKASKL
jgi:integrase